MAGVCAEHASADCCALASPRRTQNLQKNQHAWVFLGKIFQIKILMNISKLCNGKQTQLFHVGLVSRLMKPSINHFSWIFVLSRQCSCKNFTEHLLHSMINFYTFVIFAVFIQLRKKNVFFKKWTSSLHSIDAFFNLSMYRVS